jgi:mycothiol synthase
MSEAHTIELHPVVSDADASAYIDVRNRVDPADPITAAGLIASRLRPDRLDLLALHRGVPAGMGFVARNVEDPKSAYAFGKVGVLPAHRRQGLGTRLFHALSEHARSFAGAGLIVETRDDDRDTVVYLSKRGYQTVFRAEELSLDLRATAVSVDPPTGVALVALVDHALARPVYEASLEIDRDLPAVERVVTPPFIEWCAQVMNTELLRECSFAALTGGLVVGLGFLYERPWGAVHGLTGVRREWRRRGVGRAIKGAQIEAARAAGIPELRTSNEAENVFIRRLNASLGYRALGGSLQLRGPFNFAP